MNPIDIVFQSISQLTGGLITDLTTAIVGMVLLSFIAMGADLLLDVLGSMVASKMDFKKQTGRFSAPSVGKLTMESNRSSYEVPYGFRGMVRKQSTGLSDFTNRPSPVIGSLRMEKDD